MKSLTAALLSILLSLLVANCSKAPEAESGEASKPPAAIKWFDSLNGDEMAWDVVREYTSDEFSGVTFRLSPELLEAVAEGEARSLYSGMPIWSVYFCDLTGDGKSELCSTLSMGSGVIDERVIVYDYAEGLSYELSDRGSFDYALNMREGTLIVEKRAYMQEELLEAGELVLADGALHLKSE